VRTPPVELAAAEMGAGEVSGRRGIEKVVTLRAGEHVADGKEKKERNDIYITSGAWVIFRPKSR
jgi:hypothetical protein